MKYYLHVGAPVSINFSETLLSGELIPCLSNDEELFLSIGTRLNISSSFDRYQLEAYNHVAKYQMSLVQGPPGTGKSYLASHIAFTFAKMDERVAIITSKNHALDETLIDIGKLYGEHGIDNIIRIGT